MGALTSLRIGSWPTSEERLATSVSAASQIGGPPAVSPSNGSPFGITTALSLSVGVAAAPSQDCR